MNSSFKLSEGGIVKVNKNSCDNCFYKKKACDRVIPCCSTCFNKNEDCSYLRKSKKRLISDKNPEIYKNVRQFTLERKRKQGSNLTNIFQSIGNRKRVKYQGELLAFKVVTRDAYYIAIRNFLDLYKKGFTSFLNVLFHFPMRHNHSSPSRNLFIKIAYHLQSFTNIHKDMILDPYIYWDDGKILTLLKENQNYLEWAERTYFNFNDIFLPLFIRSSFKKHKRSLGLKCTIYACGMQLLPSNLQKKELLDHLLQYIYYFIKKEYKSINLSMVQLILVYIHGLQVYNWGDKSIKINLSLPLNMAHALGLHQKRYHKRLNRWEIIERRFAYNRIIFFESLASIGMDNHAMFTLDQSYIEIDDYYCYNSKNLTYINYSLQDSIKLLLSDSIGQLTFVINDFRYLRYHTMKQSISPKQFTTILQNILDKLEQILSFPQTKLFGFCEEMKVSINYIKAHTCSIILNLIQLIFYMPYEIPSILIDFLVPNSTSFVKADDLAFSLSTSKSKDSDKLLLQPDISLHLKHLSLGISIARFMFSIEMDTFANLPYFATRSPLLTMALVYLIGQYQNLKLRPASLVPPFSQTCILQDIKFGYTLLENICKICPVFAIDTLSCLKLVDRLIKEYEIKK